MFSASIQNRSMVVSLRSTRLLDQFTYSPFNLFIQAWSSSKKSSHERDEITYSQCDVLLAVSLFFMSCRMDYYDHDGKWKPESGESVIIVNPRADYRKEERAKFLIIHGSITSLVSRSTLTHRFIDQVSVEKFLNCVTIEWNWAFDELLANWMRWKRLSDLLDRCFPTTKRDATFIKAQIVFSARSIKLSFKLHRGILSWSSVVVGMRKKVSKVIFPLMDSQSMARLVLNVRFELRLPAGPAQQDVDWLDFYVIHRIHISSTSISSHTNFIQFPMRRGSASALSTPTLTDYSWKWIASNRWCSLGFPAHLFAQATPSSCLLAPC